MNIKILSFSLIICATIMYARSIYFDSHFLVQISIMSLIGGLMGLMKSITKNQFRTQIAWGSILVTLYGLTMSIFFVELNRYVIRGMVGWLVGIGHVSYLLTIRNDYIKNMRAVGGWIAISMCVIISLWYGANRLILHNNSSAQETIVLPTYDRISASSTGQILIGVNRVNIISTGILPISGQHF